MILPRLLALTTATPQPTPVPVEITAPGPEGPLVGTLLDVLAAGERVANATLPDVLVPVFGGRMHRYWIDLFSRDPANLPRPSHSRC